VARRQVAGKLNPQGRRAPFRALAIFLAGIVWSLAGHCAPPIFAVQRDRDRWIVRGPTPERFGDSVGIVAVVDMHVGRRSATVLRMTENEVFTALPCLSGACLDHRADRLRCRIGAFYLRALAGEKPAVPPLSEILRNCCKNEFASFTLAKPRHHGRSSPLFWEKPR